MLCIYVWGKDRTSSCDSTVLYMKGVHKTVTGAPHGEGCEMDRNSRNPGPAEPEITQDSSSARNGDLSPREETLEARFGKGRGKVDTGRSRKQT